MTSFPPALRAAVVSAAALALGTLAGAALAQTPAAAPNSVVLPKPDCGTKPASVGRLASDRQKERWRKDASAYLQCFGKFATEQRVLAQRYTDAANAVIDEYYAAEKEIQAANDALAE